MAENMPVLQEQVRTDATVGSGSQIAASLADFAQAPTVLGIMGQNLAQSASDAYQRQRGYELAQNPKGELLPAITSADKAFNEAYMAQAGTTLGLQAQQLMGKASLELEQSYNLSQEGIEAFHKNVGEGLKQILDQAPSMMRPKLEAQYKNALDSETINYLGKMQSQQKQIAKDKSFVYESTQAREILNNNLSGTEKGMAAATEAYQNGLERINQRVASGEFTPSQGQAATLELQEKYFSSRMQAGLIAAQSEKKEAEYLANLPKQKPDDVPWDIYLRAISSTVAFQGQTESLRSRYENLITSNAIAVSKERSLSALELEEIKEQVSPARYANFVAQYISSTGAKALNQTDSSGYSDPNYWSTLTAKQQNSLFDAAVAERADFLINKNPRMTQEQATAQAELDEAINAGGAVPKFIKKLSAQIAASTNPDVAISAIQQYKRLNEYAPFKTKGIDQMSNVIANKYLTHASLGEDRNTALAMARELAKPLDETKQQYFMQQADIALSKARKDPVSRIKFAAELSGLPLSDMSPQNANVLSNQLMSAYKDLYTVYQGDTDAVKTHIENEVSALYGYSFINGTKEFVALPIEAEMGVNNDSVLINDLKQHLQRQFDIQKKAYNEGAQDVYYELKTPLPSVEAIEKLNTLKEKWNKIDKENAPIGELAKLNNEYIELKNQIENDKTVVFDEVHRDSSRYPRIARVAYDPLSATVDDNGRVIGGRAINVVDENGKIAPLYGAFGGRSTLPNWNPDPKALQLAAANWKMNELPFESRIQSYMKKERFPTAFELATGLLRKESISEDNQ